jgi:RNA polymerase sigma-70 factor (ECF subfamily)
VSSDQLSDDTLIQAIASGQGWAMAILYQRYSSLLYAFAYRIVADHMVAEDLLQESFLAVWQRASSYSPHLGAVYIWLVAITHHRAIDYVRSRRSYVVFTLGEVKTTGRATLNGGQG